jgi:hypothetical protein
MINCYKWLENKEINKTNLKVTIKNFKKEFHNYNNNKLKKIYKENN